MIEEGLRRIALHAIPLFLLVVHVAGVSSLRFLARTDGAVGFKQLHQIDDRFRDRPSNIEKRFFGKPVDGVKLLIACAINR